MSDLRSCQVTTAYVDGGAVVVPLAHRDDLEGPGGYAGEGPVVMVVAPVPLTLSEVAAVLCQTFRFQPESTTVAELVEDEAVREIVADAVVNGGCIQLDEDVVTAWNDGDPRFLQYCYQRAREVFGPAPAGGIDAGRVPVGAGVGVLL